MKNKMWEVANILEIDMDKEFNIIGDKCNSYKLTSNDLIGETGNSCVCTLMNLLRGEEEIEKNPPLKNRRIISINISTMSNCLEGDKVIFIIGDAIPSNNEYDLNIKLLETHNGLKTNEIGLLLMRYYNIYGCSDVILDTNGVGLGVYDFLTYNHFDELTGLMYCPLSCCNNEVIDKRCGSKNSSNVVWSINGTRQFNFNSFILLERYIQRKRVHISSTVPECNETVRQLITGNLNVTEKALGIGQEIYLLLAYNCTILDMIKNGKNRTN